MIKQEKEKLAEEKLDREDFLNEPEILPGNVPVTMPELPLNLTISTLQQFKAISEPVRTKILNIVRVQPATAKQLADRLGASPGTIGHHLKVLEEAGLVQVVARRISRGIVAKYYTRTARIFTYDMELDVTGEVSTSVEILTKALNELAEVESSCYNEDKTGTVGFPHARISKERAEYYTKRLDALINEFLEEPDDPAGEVYGMAIALFPAPSYVQGSLPLDEENE
jgi:DNA-binding transcriptional ArsR family regulator